MPEFYVDELDRSFEIEHPHCHWYDAVQGIKFFRSVYPDRPLHRVVDIGANAGSVGIWAALKGGADHVSFYEFFRCDRLVANLRRLDILDKCTVHNEAVWRTTGVMQPAKLHFGMDGQAGLMLMYDSRDVDLGGVKTVSFQEVIEREGGPIDFLKIDVEGSEYNFLGPDDETRRLLQNVQVLDIEFHRIVELNPILFHPAYTNVAAADTELKMFLADCGFSVDPVISGQRMSGDQVQGAGAWPRIWTRA